jgi:hypothetical protein
MLSRMGRYLLRRKPTVLQLDLSGLLVGAAQILQILGCAYG